MLKQGKICQYFDTVFAIFLLVFSKQNTRTKDLLTINLFDFLPFMIPASNRQLVMLNTCHNRNDVNLIPRYFPN